MKKVYIFIIILLLACLCLFIFFNKKEPETNSNQDLVKYESDLLDFNFQKYVKNASGEIIQSEVYEDYAKLVFEIKDNSGKDLINALNSEFSDYTEEYNDMVKESPTMNLINDVNEATSGKEIISVNHIFTGGKIAKTREIYLFVCKSNSTYYLYIFG